MAQDGVNLWQALGSFVLVLGLLIGFAYALKWWAEKKPFAALQKNRRLKLVESLQLDAKHRMVIVARDAVEHVVLLSPEGALHVETLEAKA